jgi:hypothetical protein
MDHFAEEGFPAKYPVLVPDCQPTRSLAFTGPYVG